MDLGLRVKANIYCALKSWASLVAQTIRSLCNAGDARQAGSTPGSGRTPGGGNGNPLQYTCLENPTNRGARQATVHEVTESATTEHNIVMETWLVLVK